MEVARAFHIVVLGQSLSVNVSYGGSNTRFPFFKIKHKIMKYIFFFIFSYPLFSQNKININDKAPIIHVTDYILNTPLDKNLTNKFTVLEFWATWCKPCLKQVPHLNRLQEKFKERKDLIFISITEEKPEKVLRTLNRVPFNSIVVSDQSGKTFKDFIEDESGNYTIPITILIDNNDIIKWYGNPSELNEEKIEKFINQNEVKITENIEPKIIPPDFVKPVEERLVDVAYRVTYNKQNLNSFILLNGNNNEFKMKINSLKEDGIFFILNENLNTILADLSNTLEPHISLPNNLINKNYSVFYKNSILLNENKLRKDFKNDLLMKLNLSEKIINKKTDVYILKIIDKNKLEKAINNEEMLKKDEKQNFIFFDTDVDNALNKISNHYGKIILNDLKIGGIYDFILSNSSIEQTIKDLNYYGLTFEKSIINVKYFYYKLNQ